MDEFKKKVYNNSQIVEFIRFGIVGCIALFILYAIYYVLIQWIEHNIAYTIGYFISFICNYILTIRFTFRTNVSKKNSMGFALSHFINYLMQVGCLNLFIFFGLSEQIAPIPTFIICVPSNFLLVKFFVKK